MSDWHDELELALLPLEDLRVDSVYMTFVISNALSERGIFHQCRIGYAEDRLGFCTDVDVRGAVGDGAAEDRSQQVSVFLEVSAALSSAVSLRGGR